MVGLIVEILFMLFSVYNPALYGLKMNEYEAHWLAGFLLINSCTPGSNYCNLKQTSVRKISNFTGNSDYSKKSKETRAVTYTCRYFSGHLIPMIQTCSGELGINCPLEYLQMCVATLDSSLFDPYIL